MRSAATGSTSISSSLWIRPAINVPDTTVPKPFIVKQRSIGRRKICEASRGATSSRQPAQLRLQRLGMPSPVSELTRSSGASCEERALQVLADLHLGEIDDVALGRVDLRQHRQAALDAQQRADVEVLAGLRHHRFVGGDDQHHGVDAADAGQHVLDEPLVARHVDEPDRRLVVQRAGWQSRCRW